MVYIVEHMGTVLQLTMSLEAITNGPLFGIFTIGIFLPWINGKVSITYDYVHIFLFYMPVFTTCNEAVNQIVIV